MGDNIELPQTCFLEEVPADCEVAEQRFLGDAPTKKNESYIPNNDTMLEDNKSNNYDENLINEKNDVTVTNDGVGLAVLEVFGAGVVSGFFASSAATMAGSVVGGTFAGIQVL